MPPSGAVVLPHHGRMSAALSLGDRRRFSRCAPAGRASRRLSCDRLPDPPAAPHTSLRDALRRDPAQPPRVGQSPSAQSEEHGAAQIGALGGSRDRDFAGDGAGTGRALRNRRRSESPSCRLASMRAGSSAESTSADCRGAGALRAGARVTCFSWARCSRARTSRESLQPIAACRRTCRRSGSWSSPARQAGVRTISWRRCAVCPQGRARSLARLCRGERHARAVPGRRGLCVPFSL